MSRKKTAAQAALKDMLEAGVSITQLLGNISKLNLLNAEIGIEVSVQVTIKEEPKVKEPKIKAKKAPKGRPGKYTSGLPITGRVVINPDGTMSIFGQHSDWDFD